MEGKALAMVEIGFGSHRLHNEDAHSVVKLLREKTGIDDFSENYGKITFHLWGRDKVDYSVLDTIRDALKDDHPGLRITATEYKKTGRDYLFEGEGVKAASNDR